MAHKAPGKHHREGISLIKLFKMFPNDTTAEKWFIPCLFGNLRKSLRSVLG